MTDKEQADAFRSRFNELATPLALFFKEVKDKGFAISTNIGLTPDDKPLLECKISKVTEL